MKPLFNDLQKAIQKLEEALALEKTEITRDSAILRFQLCFDLAWKAIKAYGKTQGVECYSPKSCFQAAFQVGLIDYDEKWLAMIDDRNLITHTYEEKTADEIYSKLKEYLILFQKLATELSK